MCDSRSVPKRSSTSRLIEAQEGKSVEQESRFRLCDTTGTQEEESVCVELSNRRAVGAADVVRVDLELRVGVDERVVGQQQILVRLPRIGLLCVGADDHVDDHVCGPTRIDFELL